jgi:hypothetical protein
VIGYGYDYDKCDGDGCGVRSNQFPFPHRPGCKYGTGDFARDLQIQLEAQDKAEAAYWRGPPW